MAVAQEAERVGERVSGCSSLQAQVSLSTEPQVAPDVLIWVWLLDVESAFMNVCENETCCINCFEGSSWVEKHYIRISAFTIPLEAGSFLTF